nr:hypothetical protein CFP56_07457 [Quercus suber]
MFSLASLAVSARQVLPTLCNSRRSSSPFPDADVGRTGRTAIVTAHIHGLHGVASVRRRSFARHGRISALVPDLGHGQTPRAFRILGLSKTPRRNRTLCQRLSLGKSINAAGVYAPPKHRSHKKHRLSSTCEIGELRNETVLLPVMMPRWMDRGTLFKGNATGSRRLPSLLDDSRTQLFGGQPLVSCHHKRERIPWATPQGSCIARPPALLSGHWAARSLGDRSQTKGHRRNISSVAHPSPTGARNESSYRFSVDLPTAAYGPYDMPNQTSSMCPICQVARPLVWL